MSIDPKDPSVTLADDHQRQAGEGHAGCLHLRAMRPPLDPSEATRGDRPAAPEGLRELSHEVLEPATRRGEAGSEAGRGVARHRRDNHRRDLPGLRGRVLTRNSGAMWELRSNGEICSGSKTRDVAH